MREKALEQKFLMKVKNVGGLALKFVSPGFAGVPDRLVLMPDGKVGFVEVKSKGKKPRTLQAARHDLLRRLGFKVFVLDNENQIKNIIDEIRGERSEIHTT